MSSNVYIATDSPRYITGHSVVLAYLIVFLLGGSIAQHLLLKNENKKRLAGKRDHWIAGKSEKEIEMLGDKRYVLPFLKQANANS